MSKNVLIVYSSHAGHTARIARTMMNTIVQAGHACEMMDVKEAIREEVEWNKYDTVIVGAAVIYGVYTKDFWEFVNRFHGIINQKRNAFFNITVVARTPYKATVEGNRYMQRFIQKSPWKPQELKCFAGKVDYPHWTWYQRLAIQMIMKMTKGPTDPTTIIDYTNWEDVEAFALHCVNETPHEAEETFAKQVQEKATLAAKATVGEEPMAKKPVKKTAAAKKTVKKAPAKKTVKK